MVSGIHKILNLMLSDRDATVSREKPRGESTLKNNDVIPFPSSRHSCPGLAAGTVYYLQIWLCSGVGVGVGVYCDPVSLSDIDTLTHYLR